MQENREHQNFHVGLKAFIADGDKLLILQDWNGLWELPGGRAEQHEIFKPITEILSREVAEELGEHFEYTIGPIFHAWIRKPLEFNEYKNKRDLYIFLVGFHCLYKSGRPALSPEHQNFRWVTKEEVKELQFENTYEDAINRYFQDFGN